MKANSLGFATRLPYPVLRVDALPARTAFEAYRPKLMRVVALLWTGATLVAYVAYLVRVL